VSVNHLSGGGVRGAVCGTVDQILVFDPVTMLVEVAVIRVLIVDDHALVRASLNALLGADAELEVVGECVDGAEVVAACTTTRPDVVLMDIRMPRMSGITAAAELKVQQPEVRVLMLTASISADNIARAAAAGAVGFLLKDGDPSHLRGAIRTVAGGGTAWPASSCPR
jgi:DNA-binding NarL/FixJ family response regulator